MWLNKIRKKRVQTVLNAWGFTPVAAVMLCRLLRVYDWVAVTTHTKNGVNVVNIVVRFLDQATGQYMKEYECRLTTSDRSNIPISEMLGWLLSGLRRYDTTTPPAGIGFSFKGFNGGPAYLTANDKAKIDQVSDRLAAVIEYVKELEQRQ